MPESGEGRLGGARLRGPREGGSSACARAREPEPEPESEAAAAGAAARGGGGGRAGGGGFSHRGAPGVALDRGGAS